MLQASLALSSSLCVVNRMLFVIIALFTVFEQVGLLSWDGLLVLTAKRSDQSLFSFLLAKEVFDQLRCSWRELAAFM